MCIRDSYKSTTSDVRKIVDEFKDIGIDAIVIDLRGNSGGPVSYTHLRAHETKANLVCRLLLEKKKKQQKKKHKSTSAKLNNPHYTSY